MLFNAFILLLKVSLFAVMSYYFGPKSKHPVYILKLRPKFIYSLKLPLTLSISLEYWLPLSLCSNSTIIPMLHKYIFKSTHNGALYFILLANFRKLCLPILVPVVQGNLIPPSWLQDKYTAQIKVSHNTKFLWNQWITQKEQMNKWSKWWKPDPTLKLIWTFEKKVSLLRSQLLSTMYICKS